MPAIVKRKMPRRQFKIAFFQALNSSDFLPDVYYGKNGQFPLPEIMSLFADSAPL